MPPMLETEVRAFERMLPRLLSEAPGEYALFHGEQFGGCFATMALAVDEGYRRFGNVAFLVEPVQPEPEVVQFASTIKPPG